MANEPVSGTSLEELLADPPRSRSRTINTLWRDGASIVGPLSLLADVKPEYRLDLLETVRVVAMSDTSDPETIAHVLENAGSSSDNNGAAVHCAATVAIAKPEMMRWVSANAGRVAALPNWKVILPGLGGAVMSVPLAEEALGHLVAAKADLPRELTRLVQLNPWFTRRFAIQFRRYTGGKRIRVQDRAATARAWSHARTLLRPELPPQWQPRHGRGGNRQLDEWSHRFLVRYAGLVRRIYRGEGIPPVMAPLFAIASAADVANAPTLDAVASWQALPADIERDALNMIGIGPSPGPGLEPSASHDTGSFHLKSSQGMIPKISWR